MTNEQQIEVWRKQFESLFDDNLLSRGNHGEYINDHRNSMWHGFLLAKCTMPVIEIPAYDMHHYAPVRNIMAQIGAAGYQYKVK